MKLIDFHSHIIPRADHGSSSVDTSLLQLQYAAKNGFSRVVATPHFYPYQENVARFIARRDDCYARLKEQITEDLPEVILGAEVLICDNLESMPDLDLLCISGTNILLIELPFTDFSDSFVYSIKMLIKNGYDVILAHADRYNPRNIDRLVAVGAKIQLNVDSLSHMIIPAHIKNWVADNLVVALGSDIHGPDRQAYKRFIKALKHLGEKSDSIMQSTDELLSTHEDVEASNVSEDIPDIEESVQLTHEEPSENFLNEEVVSTADVEQELLEFQQDKISDSSIQESEVEPQNETSDLINSEADKA